MRKVKKLVTFGLAVILLLSLGACDASRQSATGTDSPGSESASTQDEMEQKEESKAVTLKWYMAGSGPQADVEAVQDAINNYLFEAYGMNVKLQIIATDYANYSQKIQMVISSGEEYDICWTSSWNNNYYDNVNRNAFLELDDLLASEASELLESMDDSIWDGVRVKGNIYGIPSQQIFPKQNYVVIEKEYIDKYNLDTSTIKKLSDLEEFFLQVKEDHPEIYPLAASSNGLVGKLNLSLNFEPIIGSTIPGVISIDETEAKIINQYEELDSLKEFYELMYSWQQKGIVRQDAVTVSDNAVPDMKAGKHIAAVNATYKPGVEVIEKGNFGGRDVEFIMLSDAYTATDSLVSSLNAISRTSKNPEIAMKFLNLVNTDAKLYNMLCFGVEDIHYTLNEEGKVVSDDSKGYNPNIDWMMGNQFNGLLRDGQDNDVWEMTKEINTSATESRILGFAFDSTTVTNELAAISAVVDQYALSLETGAVNPEQVLPEFVSKLKAAGSDKLIEEIQNQLDSWLDNNK